MLTVDLLKQIVEASLEFGYIAKSQGVSLEQAKKRYDEIMEELLKKWEKENK